MTDAPALSLVLPCWNEASNLPALVARCAEVIARPDVEVLFVDNGSTDGTADLLPRLLAPHAFARRVRVERNQGYGHGVLCGLRLARGRFLAWTHADLQADPADAVRALELAERSPDPDRVLVKGKRLGRPAWDVAFTWAMAAFESAALGRALWDVHGQPTLLPRAFFESWQDPPLDFSLDVFALALARPRGLRVLRLPVAFGARRHGMGSNETLKAKLRYSRRTIGAAVGLRRRIRAESRIRPDQATSPCSRPMPRGPEQP